jgi:hypothetical protein
MNQATNTSVRCYNKPKGFVHRVIAFAVSLPLRLSFQILCIFASATLKKQYKYIGAKHTLTYFLMQRVFRINSHVPWPVHWASIVSSPDRIHCKSYRPFPGYMPGQYIQAINGIVIGKNVRLGPGVKLISANHDTQDYDKHIPATPVVIGDNVWLGADVIVLPGVEIGEHVIVGAGAVVTKSIAKNSLVAGVPAKVVKQLSDYGKGEWQHRMDGPRSDEFAYHNN